MKSCKILTYLLAGVPDFVFLMFDRFNLFFLGVILLALAIDMIDDTVRTLHACV